jgi:hypothetical protein
MVVVIILFDAWILGEVIIDCFDLSKVKDSIYFLFMGLLVGLIIQGLVI